MGILDEFNPARDGWSFVNWGESPPTSAGTCTGAPTSRSTRPTIRSSPRSTSRSSRSSRVAPPTATAAAWRCSRWRFSSTAGTWASVRRRTSTRPPTTLTTSQPARADLHEAINIMQARQFSAPGIRNFLDVVKAGQLNDGVAAWHRIRSGLASGDYCMLSLSNGLFGDAAHTIIPYRADMSGSAYVLHVWNSNVPYKPGTPTTTTGCTTRSSSPVRRLALRPERQPDNIGEPCLRRIEQRLVLRHPDVARDSQGPPADQRRLRPHRTDDAVRQRHRCDRHPDRGRRGPPPLHQRPRAPQPRRPRDVSRLAACQASRRGRGPVAARGDLPGELFFFERPPGSSPLNVSVRGDEYHLMHLSSGHLTELTAGRAAANAKDRVRLEGSPDDDQSIAVSTSAPRRRFDIHHLRHDAPGAWRSVKVQQRARHQRPAAGARASRVRRRRDLRDDGTSRRRRRASPLRRRQARDTEPRAAARPRRASPAHGARRLGAPLPLLRQSDARLVRPCIPRTCWPR